MSAITHYEVYQATSGQWAMVRRFGARERDLALGEARILEEQNLPAAVVEENEDLATAQFDIRLIHVSPMAGPNVRAPANGNDLGSRLFMIALNALTAGAIVLVLAALTLSQATLSPMWRNVALLSTFLVATVIAGLLLLRVYIPLGTIWWRAKDPESRRRTALTLTQGRVVLSASLETAIAPAPPLDAAAVTAHPSNAFETSVTVTSVASHPPPPLPPAPLTPLHATAPGEPTPAPLSAPLPAAEHPPSVSPAATALRAQAQTAILDGLRPALAAFTEETLVSVSQARATLTASERLALNLYLMGAASAAAHRSNLDHGATRLLARGVLEDAHLSPQDIAIFFTELDIAGERPRYRRMMDDGRIAIAATLDTPSVVPPPSIADLLLRWNDAASQASEPQLVTFLQTDMVGSTAMTGELGNAGAQRVLRAHNAIVRTAAKAFRGREVKHTGDGMLLIFPDSTTGARAAIDIQQEAANYALDNPAAPLAIRIGLHTGEATYEDGEYFGPAIPIVSGLCALVGAGEICCSGMVRQKVPSNFRFEELGARTVAGAAVPVDALKLAWEPKRPMRNAATLEYRQIGATSAPAVTSASEVP